MPVFHTATLTSPYGEIALAVNEEGALAALLFDGAGRLPAALGPDPELVPDAQRTAKVVEELEAYFGGDLHVFSVQVAPVIGSEFQRKVWSALSQIRFGETWSYARLAADTGSVARAVGSANGANPICLVVPCHRVLGANGALTGYSGGLERKRALLQHEGALLF